MDRWVIEHCDNELKKLSTGIWRLYEQFLMSIASVSLPDVSVSRSGGDCFVAEKGQIRVPDGHSQLQEVGPHVFGAENRFGGHVQVPDLQVHLLACRQCCEYGTELFARSGSE